MLFKFQCLCVFSLCIISIFGNPIPDPQNNLETLENTSQPNGSLLTQSAKLQQLYSLLNESLLLQTLSGGNSPTIFNEPETADNFQGILSPQSSTERLPVSELNISEEPKTMLQNEMPSILNKRQTSKSPLEYIPQKPTFAGAISSGVLGQLSPPGKPWHSTSTSQNAASETQKPSLDNAPTLNTTFEDRFNGPSSTIVLLDQKPTTKSPLEYKPQRPSFAGILSEGQLSQSIPPGKPWPAAPPTQNAAGETQKPLLDNTPTLNTTIEDRFNEPGSTVTLVVADQKPTTKSPLEYKPQRPSFAGILSEGQLSQSIPPGKPWPAAPPSQNVGSETQKPLLDNALTPNTTIEDRFNEPSSTIAQVLADQKPTTKSPLEYKPQRPSFAGILSEGQLSQSIPPGIPWPAAPPSQNVGSATQKPLLDNALTQNTTIEDRFNEPSSTIAQVLADQKPTTKSPLEYKPQRPSFAGILSEGQLSQSIPPGKPWPAAPPSQNAASETQKPLLDNAPMLNTTIEDRFNEPSSTITQVLADQKPTTKSPLEYTPQNHNTNTIGGQLVQFLPTRKPKPTKPQQLQTISVEDRFTGTTTTPIPLCNTKKPTTKSPLDYQPQRPTYAGMAGGISGGHLGQLIPPGKPWPADPPVQNITLEDRLKDSTTSKPDFTSSNKPTTKFPLEYQPQRPTFAGGPGGISGGHLGQLIPPGKPWPADPPVQNIVVEDRFKETTTIPFQSSRRPQIPENSFPIRNNPGKPTFAGILSGGDLGQLIPPGKPWPSEKYI